MTLILTKARTILLAEANDSACSYLVSEPYNKLFPVTGTIAYHWLRITLYARSRKE